MGALIVGEIGGFAGRCSPASPTRRSLRPEPARPGPRRAPARARPRGASSASRRRSVFAGCAVLEEDHRRDREDLVLRGGLLVLVDVEADDLDVVALAVDLLEDRVDDAAGAAPGGPEVDQHRRRRRRAPRPGSWRRSRRGGSPSSCSSWLSRLSWASLLYKMKSAGPQPWLRLHRTHKREGRRRRAQRWRAAASPAPARRPRATIARLIFDSPTRRSRKTIGTSTTRKPARTAR